MLAEESRLKIAARTKMKQLEEEVDHLQQQVEDEEEAKTTLQNKLMQITQQVCHLVFLTSLVYTSSSTLSFKRQSVSLMKIKYYKKSY